MSIVAGVVGVLLIAIVLWDAFETIVLPRRVTRQFRLTRGFYRAMWLPWSAVARRIRPGNQRETLLSYFGPLSLLLLVGVWAVALIVGFALVQRALGSQLAVAGGSPAGLGIDLYMSGTTFFTLGLGDVTPQTGWARLATVAEAGLGFAFLALVVSYLPGLNGAFSRREVSVSLLDERAGSPPTAFELLRRCDGDTRAVVVEQFLRDWERWSAELMESHLSFPVLGFFRSQHDNQSWLAALTMLLDLSALVLVGVDRIPTESARRAFAMARHAGVDLSQVFRATPRSTSADRLTPSELAQMRARLAEAGVRLRGGEEADRRLAELRAVYEPYMAALAEYLMMPLPSWMPSREGPDNWQTTAWER
jgi:hypothetical protein